MKPGKLTTEYRVMLLMYRSQKPNDHLHWSTLMIAEHLQIDHVYIDLAMLAMMRIGYVKREKWQWILTDEGRSLFENE
ncbi:MAG: hypothetical protein WC373_12840 [Smithella sp.]